MGSVWDVVPCGFRQPRLSAVPAGRRSPPALGSSGWPSVAPGLRSAPFDLGGTRSGRLRRSRSGSVLPVGSGGSDPRRVPALDGPGPRLAPGWVAPALGWPRLHPSAPASGGQGGCPMLSRPLSFGYYNNTTGQNAPFTPGLLRFTPGLLRFTPHCSHLFFL